MTASNDWKCAGCGKPSPDHRRNCECATSVLFRQTDKGIEHVVKTIVPLPNAMEVLWQLFRDGPTWDGNICSKAGRGDLFDIGYASRVNGWSFITAEGMEFAVRVADFGGKKDAEESKRRR